MDRHTFDDYAALLEGLYTASLVGLSPGCARIKRPGKRAHYTETASQLEAWARPYWGILPLTLGFRKERRPLPAWLAEAWRVYREGMRNGTNPAHPEYWGAAKDFDQRHVEMASLALAILVCPEDSLRGVTPETRAHIMTWLSQGLDCQLPRNNWRYFRIFALLAVASLASDDSPAFSHERLQQIPARIAADLRLLEECYLGDGWYSDGLTPQRDYYVPFAMHFYPLILNGLRDSHHAGSLAPDVSPPVEKALSRALQYAGSFRWWFDNQGRAIPFGRSMTYRFAQASFWSALATQEDLPEETRIAAFQYAHNNISWWMKQPIFHPDGTLSIGYRYENHTMAEAYNSYGGPYWAFKGLWFLAAGSKAPWWGKAVSGEPFLAFAPKNTGKDTHLQPHWRCLLRQDRLAHGDTHAWLLCAGQDASFFPGNTPEKYAKYAYSSLFGFGVSSDRRSLPHTSSDNTTLISDDGLYWRSREKTTRQVFADDFLASTWNIWHGRTELETRLEFTPNGYRRLHRLTTRHPVALVEGGFPVPWEEFQEKQCGPLAAEVSATLESVGVVSRIACESTSGGFPSPLVAKDISMNEQAFGGQILALPASSHALFEKAVVPTVVLAFPAGTHTFTTKVTFRIFADV